MIEFLKSLPLLDEPWFAPAAGIVAAVELMAVAVLIWLKRAARHRMPLGQRSVSQISHACTEEIRRLRDGQ